MERNSRARDESPDRCAAVNKTLCLECRDILPVRSSVSLEKTHRKIELNEITFRNYRRYASRAKIKMVQ